MVQAGWDNDPGICRVRNESDAADGCRTILTMANVPQIVTIQQDHVSVFHCDDVFLLKSRSMRFTLSLVAPIISANSLCVIFFLIL